MISFVYVHVPIGYSLYSASNYVHQMYFSEKQIWILHPLSTMRACKKTSASASPHFPSIPAHAAAA
jgi:hypothetical protein